MKVEIDAEQLQKEINEVATGSVSEALSGYKVRSAVADVITEEVATGAIGEAIRRALQEMDSEELTQMLASELQKATVSAVVHTLRESMVEVVARLRNLGDYSENDKKERAKIRAAVSQGVKP